jgi:hypothetical protein
MNKTFIVIIIGILFVVIGLMHNNHAKWLQDIKQNHTLTCYIDNEYKVIDPDKIVDYNDEQCYWIFTNGSAKNCELN